MSVDTTSEKARRLRDLLAELFQYDRSDLDFGIYRVLNQRRDEISRFLDDELIPSVTEVLSQESAGTTRVEQELEDAEAQARELGTDPSATPKVRELRERLTASESATQLADQVFSDLTRFFARYYDRGDFLSLRRYRPNTYSIDYEGEEVLLHWTNSDQYYIKSSESLASYAFRLPDSDRVVRFVVTAADELAGGVKPEPGQERRFRLADDPLETGAPDELLVYFNYVPAGKDAKQKVLNAEGVERLLASDLPDGFDGLAATEEDSDHSLFARHVESFTARNTHDYFIHKDLAGFLTRQLDFFVKNEVLHLDELEGLDPARVDVAMSRGRALRKVAHKVIDFLAQVEEFQKRLWLKRKLVLETSWLVTLDLVPDQLYDEVVTNEAQLAAWKELLAVDQVDGYSEPLSVEFLKANQHLVIDTRHFEPPFVESLRGSFDDLDSVTLGTVVNGENFQALELLARRYQGRTDAIFVDPPYNTGGDGFLYKDSYQHASWLTMMADRLSQGRRLLAEAGVFVASIDDDEHPRLRLLLDQVFGADDFVANVIWQKKYAPANDAKWFSDDHDHLVWYARDKESWRPTKLERTADQDALYKNPDDDSRGPWMSDNYISNKSKAERRNGWYAVVQPATGKKIWPSEKAVWRYTEDQHLANEADNRVWWGKEGTNATPRYKRFLSEVGDLVPRTIWLHEEAGHNQDGVRDLQALFGENPFPSPKPVRLMRRILAVAGGEHVMDFFAGSGTFGQAALEEARAGNGRRFVLVEAGPHVESVLRPRMIKCLHAEGWKAGAPGTRGGLSGVIKYLQIESYEDTLDNLRLERSEGQAQLMDAHREMAEDYLLHYMLDAESRTPLLGGSSFGSPHSMQATVTLDGEADVVGVDLVESFNLLLGLRVHTDRVVGTVRVITGTSPEDEGILVLWRDVAEVSNEVLEGWFEQHDHLHAADVTKIYVNGDCTLERLRSPHERWTVHLTDAEFQRVMFESADTQATG